MNSYLAIAKDPRVQLDILAVVAAHEHYLDCHGAIRDGKIDFANFLERDRAWVLARDYRGMIVNMRSCSGCHLEFVASINDRRHNCPLCSGVTIEIPCSEDTVERHLCITELIALTPKVKSLVNWGSTDAEICKEMSLTQQQLDKAKTISTLSQAELRDLLDEPETAPPQQLCDLSLSIEDLISASAKVKSFQNWGATDEEMCEELSISLPELEMAKAITNLSPAQLREMGERTYAPGEITQLLRSNTSLNTKVA